MGTNVQHGLKVKYCSCLSGEQWVWSPDLSPSLKLRNSQMLKREHYYYKALNHLTEMVSAFLEMELFRPLFCFCITVAGEAM